MAAIYCSLSTNDEKQSKPPLSKPFKLKKKLNIFSRVDSINQETNFNSSIQNHKQSILMQTAFKYGNFPEKFKILW